MAGHGKQYKLITMAVKASSKIPLEVQIHLLCYNGNNELQIHGIVLFCVTKAEDVPWRNGDRQMEI